ncbi:inositol phosphorylceramide synthase, partial [Streptomyces sp. SID6648]|nr:inositol phosphorylceramide synthase [Streptomyces sp. SID6648]
RAFARGWDRAAVRLVAYGTAVFVALLVSYRYLPQEMAAYPWAAGPLLVLAAASMVLGYVRTTRLWESEAVPARQPEPPRPAEPQPELV